MLQRLHAQVHTNAATPGPSAPAEVPEGVAEEAEEGSLTDVVCRFPESARAEAEAEAAESAAVPQPPLLMCSTRASRVAPWLREHAVEHPHGPAHAASYLSSVGSSRGAATNASLASVPEGNTMASDSSGGGGNRQRARWKEGSPPAVRACQRRDHRWASRVCRRMICQLVLHACQNHDCLRATQVCLSVTPLQAVQAFPTETRPQLQACLQVKHLQASKAH